MTLKWFTSSDDRVCPYCTELGAQGMWILDAAHDPFPDIIEYKGKPVWDAMSDQSLAHETANIPHMCRCKVGAINIDTSDIEESIRLLRQAFEQKGETEPLEPDVAE